MNATTIIVVVVVAVAVLVVGGLLASTVRRRRSRKLQEQFGPEYDRARDRHGSRKEAEQHLVDVREKREQIDVRPLDADERRRYVEEWQRVQVSFVDAPSEAVSEADLLVSRIMRDRGYPVDDFEERADLVAADHPEVVEHYRAAHAVHQRQVDGSVETEQLREAVVHYRALAEELLETRSGAGQAHTAAAGGPAAGSSTEGSLTEGSVTHSSQGRGRHRGE